MVIGGRRRDQTEEHRLMTRNGLWGGQGVSLFEKSLSNEFSFAFPGGGKVCTLLWNGQRKS